MAKKKQQEQQDQVKQPLPSEQVEPTAGQRRICPDCRLPFRHAELFDQHRAIGCKPAKSNGPTWSDKDPEGDEAVTE